jgi:hypothetical protein
MLTTRSKIISAIIGVICLWFSAWYIMERISTKKIAQYQNDVMYFKGQYQTLDDISKRLGIELSNTKSDNQRLQKEIETIKKAYSSFPVVPKPGPSPSTPEPLGVELVALGLKPGLVVVPSSSEFHSTLDIDDGKTVWNWAKNSDRIPSLEQKIVLADNTISSMEKYEFSLKTEIDLSATALDIGSRKLTSMTSLQESYKQQSISAQDALKKRKEMEPWKIVGGMILGYVVGSKIK